MSANFPQDLKYTKDHEWVRIEGKIALIGITSFAAEQLGEVVFVELPDEDDAVTKDEAFGTVESVKAVSEVIAPVSGKILRVNTPLADNPEYVSDDPYDEGWMIEVEMSDASELEELMDADEYASFVEEQE